MANDVSFNLGNLPAHIKNAKSPAMQAMAGGMSGGGFGNRISLKGSKFRVIQNGSPIGIIQHQGQPVAHLDMVMFTMAPSVQRLYYEGAYDENSKEKPTCYSHDGKTPAADSPKLQSTTCAICPQNVKGSGRLGNTKACAYKKRVIMLSPNDLEGEPYALDVNAQSMFGDQQETQNRFNFKGYYEKLSVHGVDISGIVTRMTFDNDASVPKLHFSPIRALTEEEYATVQSRLDDEQVALMLKDLTLETEAPSTPNPAPTTLAPPPAAKQQVETKAKGVGGLKKGLDVAPEAQATVPPPGTGGGGGNGKTPTKPITIDLNALTTFDD